MKVNNPNITVDDVIKLLPKDATMRVGEILKYYPDYDYGNQSDRSFLNSLLKPELINLYHKLIRK